MKKLIVIILALTLTLTACTNKSTDIEIPYTWDDAMEFDFVEYTLPDCFSMNVEKDGDETIYTSPDNSVIMKFAKSDIEDMDAWWDELLENFEGYKEYRHKLDKEYILNGLTIHRHDFTFEVDKRSSELNHIGVLVDPDVYRLNNISFSVGDLAYTVTTCIKESEYEDKAYYVLRFFDSLNILQQLP